MTKRTILKVLGEVIERHLPSASMLDWGEARSARYALRLINADIEDAERFYESRDAENLEAIVRSTATLRALINDLEWSTGRAIDRWVHPKLDNGETSFLVRAYEHIDGLELAILTLRNDQTFRTQAGRSRNWRAASVAGECRSIWADEEYKSKPKIYPPLPVNALAIDLPVQGPDVDALYAFYTQHCAEFAPKSAKMDRPGPFGLFLEEILETLGIRDVSDPSGRVIVSAQSALRSWAAASKQKLQK